MYSGILINSEVLKGDSIILESSLWNDMISEIVSDLESFFSNGEMFNSWSIVYEARNLKNIFLRILLDKTKKNLADKAIIIYINCRRRKRVYNAVLDIVRGVNKSLPTRGLSLEELLEEMMNSLRRIKKGLLLYLDELEELFFEEEFDKAKNLLYVLSRMNEKVGKPQVVSLAVITTIHAKAFSKIFTKIDGSTKASFFRKEIFLRAPTPTELVNLLREVAERAFRKYSVTEEVLERIAHWVIDKYEGDPKKAIDLLLEAAIIAEKLRDDTIELKHVNLATKTVDIRTKDIDYILQPLSRHLLVLLLAIVRTLLIKRREFVTRVEIEPIYRDLCEKFGERPRRTTQLLRYIKEIGKELEGLMRVEVSGKDQRGRSTRIYVNAPLRDLERIILKKLGVS